MPEINKKRALAGFLLSLVFLAIFIYSVSGIEKLFNDVLKTRDNFLGSISDSAILQEDIKKIIEKPEINAESAISAESNLFDVNKIIFEKNSEAKLPIASLTKLMAAIIVLDNYDLSVKTKVSKFADAQDPMKQDVKLDDVFTVENLLNIMLVSSSNKSAYALSEIMGEQKFVALMNKKTKEIGLENTYYADPTGLSAQNVSTARDLMKLAEHILKNYQKIADISRIKELDLPGIGKVVNTDQLLGEVPEIVCSKTGFTTQAKGCLLLVMNNPKNDGYIINVILGAEDRFLEMKKIINWSNTICK